MHQKWMFAFCRIFDIFLGAYTNPTTPRIRSDYIAEYIKIRSDYIAEYITEYVTPRQRPTSRLIFATGQLLPVQKNAPWRPSYGLE